jgi:hypothetical protein
MSRFTQAIVVLMMAARCADSGQPADPTPQGPGVPAGWPTHTDSDYGFTIAHPPEYVIVPEPAESRDSSPVALRRVRFQDRGIAAGQFADREPARFTVDVFENKGGRPLREWLQAAGRLPDGAAVSPFHVDGAGDGLRVRLQQLLAPNEFAYVANRGYVYGLTPLGEHGDGMLASFRLVSR